MCIPVKNGVNRQTIMYVKETMSDLCYGTVCLIRTKKKNVHLSRMKTLAGDNSSVAQVNREYVHSVAVYKKYLTRLGELIIFEPWRENYHFSQPS